MLFRSEYLVSVWFIRDNVLINAESIQTDKPDKKMFQYFIGRIDSLLVNNEKVEYARDIPAPIISGAEVLHDAQHPENFITIKINASDPRGLPLEYMYLGQGIAVERSHNGIINVPTWGKRDIFWVSNTDRIVSVLRKNF